MMAIGAVGGAVGSGVGGVSGIGGIGGVVGVGVGVGEGGDTCSSSEPKLILKRSRDKSSEKRVRA